MGIDEENWRTIRMARARLGATKVPKLQVGVFQGDGVTDAQWIHILSRLCCERRIGHLHIAKPALTRDAIDAWAAGVGVNVTYYSTYALMQVAPRLAGLVALRVGAKTVADLRAAGRKVWVALP